MIIQASAALMMWFLSLSSFAFSEPAPDSPAWRLAPQVLVHASGVYLNELVVSDPTAPLPHVRLAPAPGVGKTLTLNRVQITELVRQTVPELATTNWSGATQIRIGRRLRLLEEVEVKEMLLTALQRDYVKERGELELHFTRPWVAVSIADEPCTLSVQELPSAGITPNFILRFELRAEQVLLGNWQVPIQARIWKDVWVANAPLARGQLLRNADLVKQRRDILALRDTVAVLNQDDPSIEIAENIPAGIPLSAHSLRLRPIVLRGRLVEALVQDGAMTISMKAEVLEDGLPGQVIRARNLKSKREFRGKVQNEETILVVF